MSDDSAEHTAGARRTRHQTRSTGIGEETRLRYLRAAAELTASAGPGQDGSAFAVSRITMADVATDLGVARTTLYKSWPTKLQFWADLTTYIAATAPRPTADEVTASVMGAATASEAPQTAIDQARVALNAVQRRRLANPWAALRTALLGYAASDRLDALVGAANSQEIAEVAVELDRVLAALGVAPRAPLSVHDLAVAGFCVADGLAAAGRLSPRVNDEDIVLDGGPEGWGMLAFAIRAVIRRCTRARTPADPVPAAAFDGGSSPPPALVDQTDRWTEAQRAALAAGARRFARREHPADGRAPSMLGNVTLARLARHVGVSRQWLHRIWPSQQAFAADLITYLFEERCERVLLELRRATRRSTEVPFGGALVAADMAFDALARSAAREPLSHLTYSSHDDDPVIRERCGLALESMLDRFATDLETLARSRGLDTLDGVTYVHLATIIALTLLAAARLEVTNPGSVRTGLAYRGGEWSAVAVLIEAVVADALGLPIDEPLPVDAPCQAP